jgi:hypothetical protein
MRLLKNRSIGFYLCFVLLLTLGIGGSATTYADSSSAKVAVKAGSLTESNRINHVSLYLNKKIRLASYTLPIAVIDARGSGRGWNLMITSTTFKLTDSDKDHKRDRLPTNVSSITGVSVSCGTNSTCTNPTTSITYPLLVPAGTPPPPPVKFFNAAAGSGLGKFGLTLMVNVQVPANTERGVYTSTIILTIANGP